MKRSDEHRVRELIDRLGRISSSEEWAEGINPSQLAALSYLSRANRFSRSPSQVADFMTATRGTVSQTLKTLARKKLIEEERSDGDKRSIRYSVTKAGHGLLGKTGEFERAISSMDEQQITTLSQGLESLTRALLERRGFRAFGVCKTCRFHAARSRGGFCTLLNEPLTQAETHQICHEHSES